MAYQGLLSSHYQFCVFTKPSSAILDHLQLPKYVMLSHTSLPTLMLFPLQGMLLPFLLGLANCYLPFKTHLLQLSFLTNPTAHSQLTLIQLHCIGVTYYVSVLSTRLQSHFCSFSAWRPAVVPQTCAELKFKFTPSPYSLL